MHRETMMPFTFGLNVQPHARLEILLTRRGDAINPGRSTACRLSETERGRFEHACLSIKADEPHVPGILEHETMLDRVRAMRDHDLAAAGFDRFVDEALDFFFCHRAASGERKKDEEENSK